MENNEVGTVLNSNEIKNIISNYKNSSLKEPDVTKEPENKTITESNNNESEDIVDKDSAVPEKDNEFENLKKELSSKEKALNDTKRSYQTSNQKLVLSKKKFNSTLEELKNTLLSPDNTLLEEDEFNSAIDKLKSIFDFNEEDLEAKEEVKIDNKSKTILEKLDSEFTNFKKYNKSKDLEANYKAFFDSVHLLDVEERQNLLEYLEEAEPTDSIEKLLLLGQDYRNLFEPGLKKHKNIFKYVADLHEQISKLNEEINNSKQSIDNKFEDEDNKQIKSRASFSKESDGYNKSTLRLINMFK